MSELGPIPPALQALYADERAAPAGSSEARAQIRTRVLATLGIPAGVGAASSAASAANSTGAAGGTGVAGAASIAGKIIVLAISLGALGGLYWRASSSTAATTEQRIVAPPASPPPPPSMPAATATVAPPLPSPAAIAPSTPPSAPVVIGTPRPSPSAPVATAPPPRLAQTPAPPPRLAQTPAPPPSPEEPVASAVPESAGPTAPREHVLLVRAWAALERGEAELALDLVERHRSTYPESAFAEERQALSIVALRRLHRNAEARAGAKAFAARYPDSIHRPLVDPALEETP